MRLSENMPMRPTFDQANLNYEALQVTLEDEVERANKVYRAFKVEQECLRHNLDVSYAEIKVAERNLLAVRSRTFTGTTSG